MSATDRQAHWENVYQTKGERSDRYGKALSARNPGAQLLSVDMPGIEDRNRPVTVLAHANIPGLAERTPDKTLRLTLGTHEVDLARTYARLSERKSPLVLGYPWQHDEQIVYQIPPRFEVTHLPASRRIDSPFGHFDLQVRRQEAARPSPRAGAKAASGGQTGGATTVVVTGDLDIERDRVSAAEYPAFRRFLAEVDSAMAERITAAPRDARNGAPEPSPRMPDVPQDRREAPSPAPSPSGTPAATPGTTSAMSSPARPATGPAAVVP